MLRAITGNRYIITLLWRGMALQYSYTNKHAKTEKGLIYSFTPEGVIQIPFGL